MEAKLQPFTEEGGHDGIKLTYANTVRSETFLSQLDGYTRLSEWVSPSRTSTLSGAMGIYY